MTDFRDIILLIEEIENAGTPAPVVEEEELVESFDVEGRIDDLIFKMRAHREPLNESLQGDYCLGLETGLEMAAEMLENLLREMGRN